MFEKDNLKAMTILKNCMYEAFIFYFEGPAKEQSKIIRMDGKIWGDSCRHGTADINGWEVESQIDYVDKRARNQHKIFSKYFETSLNLELL
jgi:hypothetical protein